MWYLNEKSSGIPGLLDVAEEGLNRVNNSFGRNAVSFGGESLNTSEGPVYTDQNSFESNVGNNNSLESETTTTPVSGAGDGKKP